MVASGEFADPFALGVAAEDDVTAGLSRRVRSDLRRVIRFPVQDNNCLDHWLQRERRRALSRDLTRHVKERTSGTSRVERSGIAPSSENQAAQLVEITNDLFPPGAFDIRLAVDPDDPTDEYIVFSVSATGKHRDIFDREHKWHEEVSRIVGERATWLSLCVYPRGEPNAIDLHELQGQLLNDLSAGSNAAQSKHGRANDELSQHLLAITADKFPPGALEISLEFDPDEPDEKYLVFTVEATGETRELLDRRHQWHLAVADVVGEDAIKFRLSIYPR